MLPGVRRGRSAPERSAMPVSDQPRNREGQAESERRLGVVEGRGGPFVAAVEATRMPMAVTDPRSEEHTSELQSRQYLVCRLLLEKKKIRLHYLALHTCGLL